MDPTYLTFQKFNDPALARELADLLFQNQIEFVIEDSGSFDPTFSNSVLNKEYYIKLRPEDFEKANELLLRVSAKQVAAVDKDHYLYDFSDEELVEIITKPDEWSQFDYVLAQKLLKERGKEIKPELADTLRKQRINDLAKPEEGQKNWIYAGYATAILGGLLSIFIGWHLISHKKTLPDGKRVYAYSAYDRMHGNRIFLLGIFFLVLWAYVRIIISA